MESEKEIVKKDSFSEKTASLLVNFFYSKSNRIVRFLITLTLIGFFLRLIAVLNMDVLADDMLYAAQSAGILSAKILSTHSNPPLFFYLTDLAYKIFGYTTFASRFWPLIFGTLLIPLSFLITRKFFDEKISLFTAFFVTFSTFLIKMTFTEQTLVILFFSMFAVYFGIEYIDTEKGKYLFLSGILFGLAILTKYSTPFFILAFIIFSPIYAKFKNKKFLTKRNIKNYILFFIIILIFSLPFLTFNYLLYKDKGIVDVYFSRVIKLNSTQQLYQGLAGQDKTFFQNLKSINNYNNINLPFKSDIILALFSIIGLLILIKKKEKIALSFILILLIIPFILQTGGSTLQKHFAFMLFILAIPAGISLNYLYTKFKGHIKTLILLILIIGLIINLITISYGTPQNYLTKSSTSQLKSYINKNLESDSLIVFDQRIYTSRYFWLATDHHFLDSQNFAILYQQNQNSPNLKPVSVYFVECVIDDCGWGTIKSQPQLNSSVEAFFDQVKKTQVIPTTISEQKSLLEKPKDIYNVYKTQVLFSPEIIEKTDYLNSFYFTPYLYKNRKDYMFDYTVTSGLDNALNKISYYIILVSILLSIFIIYYTIKTTLKLHNG